MKILSPLKRPPKQFNIAAMDIETYGDENKFIMGSLALSDTDIRFFDKQSDMRDYLRDISLNRYRIFATNLDFDFFGIFGENADNEIEPCFSGSRLISVKLRPFEVADNERIFLDTLNFFPASVERLGKIVRLEKLKKPEFLGQKPKNKSQYEYLKRYNMNDSLITLKFAKYLYDGLLKQGIQTNNTIASTSLWAYRRLFMRYDFFQPSISTLEFIRKAYYGGRTELFLSGLIEKELNYYDVNSLYPFSMINDFPDTEKIQKIKHDADISIIREYSGVSYCSIDAPYMDYPILPFRDDKNRLIFPYGTWKGYYPHNELNYAIDNGYKVTPISTIYYSRTCRPFEEFVRYFYKMRKSHPDDDTVYKLILNSLYGKWGQDWNDTFVFKPMKKLRGIPSNFVMEMNGWAVLRESRKPARFANPIFSLYTTAYGRIHLHKLLSKAQGIYCDTDSIITEKMLPVSNELGGLKLEHKIKSIRLIKPKLYMMDTVDGKNLIKTKGFRIAKKDDFLKVITDKNVTNTRFTKFRQSFRLDRKVLSKYEHFMEIDLDDRKRIWDNKYSNDSISKSKPIRLIDGVVV